MHVERLRQHGRLLVFGGAALLAALLLLWTYQSFAAGAGFANLTATPNQARQNDTVKLTGTGFAPNEVVAIWITYPDFAVFGVAEVETNADGNFEMSYVPDFLGATFTPTGTYIYTARGKSSGRETYAEVNVDIGQGAPPSPAVVLHVQPGRDAQGSFFSIRGENYGPEEELSIWLRFPDNTVEDLGRIKTGPAGFFDYTLRINGTPIGRYAFTAFGNSTERTGITEFDLTVGDNTPGRGPANLIVRPTVDDQRSYAIFEGSGFAPGEVISIWVTLPDFSTRSLGELQANDAGVILATLFLGEQEPVGLRTFTAYGNSSQLRAVADYFLEPGGPHPPSQPSSDVVDAVCQYRECDTQ